VTTFASGFDLEQLLGSLYGEGGGGDAPESYGLFAHWVNTHVEIPNAKEEPFLIVFGDAPNLGDSVRKDIDAIKVWREVTNTWNTWYLRCPTG